MLAYNSFQKKQLIDYMNVYILSVMLLRHISILIFWVTLLSYFSGMTSGLHPSGRPAFGKISRHSETEGMNCTCLPQCTDMSYSISTETADLEPKFAHFQSAL
jgi:hypothetical protein